MNMVKASEKLKSFISKLPLWSCWLQGGNLENFSFLDKIVVKGDASLQKNVQLEIATHIESFSASFDNYFSPGTGKLNVMENWIINNSFKFNVNKLPDDESYKEDLIDLKESQNMKMEFESMVLENFRSAGLKTYPKLAEKALLPFLTTYLCKAGFFFLVYLKNKYQYWLETVENKLRVALSNRQP